MTFFEYLKDITHIGYEVSFKIQYSNLVIGLKKEYDNKSFIREQWLPISDHFYEKRIVECIDFMVEDISKESKQLKLM